jgi:hypothetical protein
MTKTVRKFQRIASTVDAALYDGTEKSAADILRWISRRGGTVFMAKELSWRHDFGTYWHKEHGFIYLPDGARSLGSTLERLRDDEIVVSTGRSYALVFPGDYVIRGRSGFYPLEAESFHRTHKSNTVTGE